MNSQLQGGSDLQQVARAEVWVFDLDNTLYPAHCRLFDQIDRRMTEFIATELNISKDDARRIQKDLFRRHGTTLAGLMREHGMHPQAFLDYVHEIDLSRLPTDGRLAQAMTRLAGRKLIYTNGSREHARRVTDRLGIFQCFEDCFDIVAADYVPKPSPPPYRALLRQHGVDAAKAVMVEDIARNLEPAAALGMQTVLVTGPGGAAAAVGAYVHHVVEDLTDWLEAVVALQDRARATA